MASRRNDLSAALGRAVAWLRRAHDLRQEDVAEVANSSGLGWTQATVAGLETGRRRLSAVELLLLPYVMSLVVGDEITLRDLFLLSGADSVELTPTLAQVPPADLMGYLDGSFALRVLGATRELMHAFDATLLETRAAGALGVSIDDVRDAAHQRWGKSLAGVLQERVDLALGQVPKDDASADERTVRMLLEPALLQELRMTLGAGRGRTA